jgi:1,4-dihydroxy-2-naphthoate polyprenyltransferase
MDKSKLKAWVQAARLRTLPLALSSIGMGGFLAFFYNEFNPTVFILCVLTTLFLQILSNFANDYGDSVHGADSKERKGPQRVVQAGLISKEEMKRAVIIFSFLSLVTGLALLYASFENLDIKFVLFLLLGFSAIAAAIKYTAGSNPYGYSGFGDLFVFIFFGIVAVAGTFYLQTGEVIPSVFLPGITLGCFSVGVLNINNIRDIESDKKAGKYSIPVRIGERQAKIYHSFLLVIALAAAIIFSVNNYAGPWQFLFVLALPLIIINLSGVWKNTNGDLDPYLKQMAITTLVFVLLFGSGILLSV